MGGSALSIGVSGSVGPASASGSPTFAQAYVLLIQAVDLTSQALEEAEILKHGLEKVALDFVLPIFCWSRIWLQGLPTTR